MGAMLTVLAYKKENGAEKPSSAPSREGPTAKLRVNAMLLASIMLDRLGPYAKAIGATTQSRATTQLRYMPVAASRPPGGMTRFSLAGLGAWLPAAGAFQ